MSVTATNGTVGRRITTHEATVKTAAVEIKQLTVTGRQVTLAVFRQLAEEPIIRGSASMAVNSDVGPDPWTLAGVPWGWVNYCPGKGKCAGTQPEREHFHVVWQKGDELRRAAVFPSPDMSTVDDWVGAVAYLWLHALKLDPDKHAYREVTGGGFKCSYTHYAVRRKCTEIVGDGYWRGVNFRQYFLDYETADQRAQRLQATARDYGIDSSIIKDTSALQALLQHHHHARIQHAFEYQELVGPLSKLDHLFIAV